VARLSDLLDAHERKNYDISIQSDLHAPIVASIELFKSQWQKDRIIWTKKDEVKFGSMEQSSLAFATCQEYL
jgi:hypothetical protein